MLQLSWGPVTLHLSLGLQSSESIADRAPQSVSALWWNIWVPTNRSLDPRPFLLCPVFPTRPCGFSPANCAVCRRIHLRRKNFFSLWNVASCKSDGCNYGSTLWGERAQMKKGAYIAHSILAAAVFTINFMMPWAMVAFHRSHGNKNTSFHIYKFSIF